MPILGLFGLPSCSVDYPSTRIIRRIHLADMQPPRRLLWLASVGSHPNGRF